MKNLWRSITTDNAASRLAEDVLYTVVYEEIENGQIDKAAQARAIDEGRDNEGAIRAAYIKHRIARIRAEIEITTAQAVAEEKQKQLDVEIEKQRIKRKQIAREISDFLILCFILFFYSFTLYLFYCLTLLGSAYLTHKYWCSKSSTVTSAISCSSHFGAVLIRTVRMRRKHSIAALRLKSLCMCVCTAYQLRLLFKYSLLKCSALCVS